MATATYEYKVRDRAGKLVSGKLEADSPAAVATKLKAMGYAPLSVTETNTGMGMELKLPGFGGKVKLKELAIFSRQFATMINSGLSLLRSLNILFEQQDNATFKKVLGEVRVDIEQGVSLSTALGKHPKVFPVLFVNMTKAGEVGGFLDTVLLQIAENYESEVKLRGKVKAAMTYPVVVFVLAIVMSLGMLIFIVPTFAGLFKSLGGTLPLPTRIMVMLSNGLKSFGPEIAVLVVVLWQVWQRTKDRESVKNFLDPLRLKAPVFGALFQKIALTRWTRNLGMMLRAGVPILQSLDIVGSTSGNVVLEKATRAVQDSVRQGESLAKPLMEHSVFPPMVVQMMSVGEDTGALDNMLEKIAQFYDQEVEATTESLTALIEPLMIAFLGAIVGSMIVAMYMPIFKIFNLIN